MWIFKHRFRTVFFERSDNITYTHLSYSYRSQLSLYFRTPDCNASSTKSTTAYSYSCLPFQHQYSKRNARPTSPPPVLLAKLKAERPNASSSSNTQSESPTRQQQQRHSIKQQNARPYYCLLVYKMNPWILSSSSSYCLSTNEILESLQVLLYKPYPLSPGVSSSNAQSANRLHASSSSNNQHGSLAQRLPFQY